MLRFNLYNTLGIYNFIIASCSIIYYTKYVILKTFNSDKILNN